ncbi:hypothetical protein ACFFMR_17960 [Micromonospora andamanensis]|uniref:Uncharacterized protein n=1 Tax=Micromonospora andamanensis TaxID=1287068 RepID=A0ABQ4I0L1_9ACTN|nr:hypothetical protein [Micromonospora andamanensis]GIJ11458.1 hypothetical protein Van01_46720 [Micromonospora andamanensis]
MGVGFLIGALSSDPASADIADLPTALTDVGEGPSVGQRASERVRPTAPVDDLIAGLVDGPQARQPDQARRSDQGRAPRRGSPGIGRPDDERGAEQTVARSGRPDRDRPATPVTARTARSPSADEPPADRAPIDSGEEGLGSGRRVPTVPTRPTVPVVGDRAPAPDRQADLPPLPALTQALPALPAVAQAPPPLPPLPAVTRAATGPAPLAGADAVIAQTGTLTQPVLTTVVGQTTTVARPVLSTVVTAVSSGVDVVVTPVVRVVDLVTPALPVLSGCPGTGSSTVVRPILRMPTTAPTPDVADGTGPGRSLAPDPPAAAPSPGKSAPTVSLVGVSPAAPLTGVAVSGWHRPSTGPAGAGSGSTPKQTGGPHRPANPKPGGDGVRGADSGPGPLRGLTLDGCGMPATASARPDIPAPRGHASRLPGVATRPG